MQEFLIQLHGFRIARGRRQRLLGEPAALLDRVDKFGVGDAHLDAADDQVPGLCEPRILAVWAG